MPILPFALLSKASTALRALRTHPAFIGSVCALLATLVWSGNFIAGRAVIAHIPPITLAFLRWLVAFVAILPMAVPAVIRQWPTVRAHLGYYIVVSGIGIALFNTFIYMAAHTVPALNMTLIATTSPLFVIALSRIFYGEHCGWLRVGGIALALCGIVLLMVRGDLSLLAALRFQAGDLLMVCAALSFASYTLLLRNRPKETSQLTFFAVTFGMGLIMLTPFMLWELHHTPLVLTPQGIGAVLYIGLGASLVAFWLWERAIREIGPARSAVLYYSLPLFSGVEAVLLLGEPVIWVHYASATLIISGLVMATRK